MSKNKCRNLNVQSIGRERKNSKIAQTYLEKFCSPLEGDNCSKSSRYKERKISQIKLIKPLSPYTKVIEMHGRNQGENVQTLK
jgi:hypothetical protein